MRQGLLLAATSLLGLFSASSASQTVFSLPRPAAPLDGLRLIQLSPDSSDTQWLSREDRLALKNEGLYFKDVTNSYNLTTVAVAAEDDGYGKPNSTLVGAIIAHVDPSYARKHVGYLSSLHTRWCETATGEQGSEYLLDVVRSYVAAAPRISARTIDVVPVVHEFKQFSIVLRIAHVNTSSTDPVAIIGGHMDSASRYGNFERAPGADDDASGTATVLEAARLILLHSTYVPSSGRAIEFHLYAGEEAGLLGSQAIANEYAIRGVRVRGMIQFDMTAWVTNPANEHVGITVSRNKALSEFNKLLVDQYLDIPWVEESTYPWGASDSASWGDLGYPSSDALEGTWPETRGHRVHTVEDVTSHAEYSFDHMMQFAKLAVAFLIELGGEA
ncbi:Zn-dependent exopeptidase [Exidia glandulosa HHB12029]|uniref:Peptide hydrolase n=1 Tax=Exidia glandulosa HHB12029 TaxID=1314781 RepID=A0A165DGR7_EXIGL|nr:Zn-dependent exopeptidase [Exidia glandulosa HHB12029]